MHKMVLGYYYYISCIEELSFMLENCKNVVHLTIERFKAARNQQTMRKIKINICVYLQLLMLYFLYSVDFTQVTFPNGPWEFSLHPKSE